MASQVEIFAVEGDSGQLDGTAALEGVASISFVMEKSGSPTITIAGVIDDVDAGVYHIPIAPGVFTPGVSFADITFVSTSGDEKTVPEELPIKITIRKKGRQ